MAAEYHFLHVGISPAQAVEAGFPDSPHLRQGRNLFQQFQLLLYLPWGYAPGFPRVYPGREYPIRPSVAPWPHCLRVSANHSRSALVHIMCMYINHRELSACRDGIASRLTEPAESAKLTELTELTEPAELTELTELTEPAEPAELHRTQLPPSFAPPNPLIPPSQFIPE